MRFPGAMELYPRCPEDMRIVLDPLLAIGSLFWMLRQAARLVATAAQRRLLNITVRQAAFGQRAAGQAQRIFQERSTLV